MKIPTEMQMELLRLLVSEKNGREIAKAFKKATGKPISYGSLYTMLGRMVERGWVKARTSEEDARLKLYEVDGEGRRAFNAAITHSVAIASRGMMPT